MVEFTWLTAITPPDPFLESALSLVMDSDWMLTLPAAVRLVAAS